MAATFECIHADTNIFRSVLLTETNIQSGWIEMNNQYTLEPIFFLFFMREPSPSISIITFSLSVNLDYFGMPQEKILHHDNLGETNWGKH